jgi:hypothetical protein
MNVAVGIDYKIWRRYIHLLLQDNWKVIEKYCGYDASIDFDFVMLRKNGITMKFGMDEINGGEIKTNKKGFEILKSINETEFNFGKPRVLNLRTMIIIRPSTFFTRFIPDKRKLMEDFFYFRN